MRTPRGLLHRLALVAVLLLLGGVTLTSSTVRDWVVALPRGMWIVAVAIAGTLWLAGLRWLRGIVSMDEGEPRAWRYRDRHAVPRPDAGSWWHRTIEALDAVSPRTRMRVLLLAAVGLIGVAVVGLLRSGALDPTFDAEFARAQRILPAAIAGMLVGLAWMVRIYRRPLEDEAPAWRYRDRD